MREMSSRGVAMQGMRCSDVELGASATYYFISHIHATCGQTGEGCCGTLNAQSDAPLKTRLRWPTRAMPKAVLTKQPRNSSTGKELPPTHNDKRCRWRQRIHNASTKITV